MPGEHPRVINLAPLASIDSPADKWYYEVPSFYSPQVMSPVAEAVAALDTYMFDEGGRYDFAVRAVENATLDEAEHDIRPQAYWRTQRSSTAPDGSQRGSARLLRRRGGAG